MAKTFVLTFVKGESVIPIKQYESVQVLQLEKKKYKSDPKYNVGKFQIRTLEGFKAKKIL